MPSLHPGVRGCTGLAVAALAGLAAASGEAARPPQTDEQQKIIRQHTGPALLASTAATSVVRALFADNRTAQYLREVDDGSGLFKLTPQQLEGRFWQGLEWAELVHNFGDGASAAANCGYDFTVAIGDEDATLPNQWQLQVSGQMPIDPAQNWFSETSEVGLFGFPPMANTSAPDAATANSRPFYSAINMYRGAGGNPQCGPVSAVLRRNYLRQQVLAAPLDTGFFVGGCSPGGPGVGSVGNHSVGKCDAWTGQRTIGVPPLVHHLLNTYLHFWNTTEPVVGPADYPYLNLARLLVRLLSPNTYAAANPKASGSSQVAMGSGSVLPLNFVENTLGYFEYNPAAAIDQPGGVKLMVGMFELVWGTELGERLIQWCEQRGYPLAWAYNPAMSFYRCGVSGTYPECTPPADLAAPGDAANIRILDPRVLSQVPAGHNVSVSEPQRRWWDQQWTAFNASAANRSQIATAWGALVSDAWTDFAVQPTFPNSCLNRDCAGVRLGDGACVCDP